jgi:hypothetical protein
MGGVPGVKEDLMRGQRAAATLKSKKAASIVEKTVNA